jgi:hypothetical protein
MDAVTLLVLCGCYTARDVGAVIKRRAAINDSSRGGVGSCWPRLEITTDCYIKQMWRQRKTLQTDPVVALDSMRLRSHQSIAVFVTHLENIRPA